MNILLGIKVYGLKWLFGEEVLMFVVGNMVLFILFILIEYVGLVLLLYIIMRFWRLLFFLLEVEFVDLVIVNVKLLGVIDCNGNCIGVLYVEDGVNLDLICMVDLGIKLLFILVKYIVIVYFSDKGFWMMYVLYKGVIG